MAVAISALVLIAAIRAAVRRVPSSVSVQRARLTLVPATTNDVSQQLFLLINSDDITSERFSAPTVQPDHWDFGGGSNTALNWNNWDTTGRLSTNLSYSYRNPFAAPKPSMPLHIVGILASLALLGLLMLMLLPRRWRRDVVIGAAWGLGQGIIAGIILTFLPLIPFVGYFFAG